MKVSLEEIYLSSNNFLTLADVYQSAGKQKKELPLYTDPTHVLEYETHCKSCKTSTTHEPGIAIREKKYVVESRCSCCKKKKVHEVTHDLKNGLPNI